MSSEERRTSTYRLWQRLRSRPGGRQTFSAGVSMKAPYFRTITPVVQEMEPGRAVVKAPKWWGVTNHIGTFHAIAACNVAEFAMGMVAEATVPTTHRWLPKAMDVRYLAKAETSLTATATLDPVPDFEAITEGEEVVVPVAICDRAGTEVVHADITIWVTPKS
jgi:acyl-coenzyme A thioesterase PaaI-like protein